MVGILIMLLLILQAVAFMTLLERHLLGGSQCRVGPNKVGVGGILQAIFDGVKLMKKEQIVLESSSFFVFLGVPVVGFLSMGAIWFTLCYFFEFLSFKFSGVFLLCVMSFFVFSVLLSGVFSGSKYSFLGGLRSSVQSFSYEIAFSLYFLCLLLCYGSLSIFKGFYLVVFLMFFCFLFFILVDLHRAPFDFSECESELVSGYNVEYSSVGFAVLFLSEYGNIIFFSCLLSCLFFNFSFFIVYMLLFFVIFSRSAYPRFRFDKLMAVCWLGFLPLGIYLFGFYLFLLF
uniref:NADH dehydrogenase subunit 1 n=1 Tax=Physaloptera clausa TaxID=3051302 RepID=UPI003002586E|nr:NADH dehydrogenase subunit 1 [Physaloptera clausa]